MAANTRKLEKTILSPLTPGVIHKLFLGKNITIEELTDVEYINIDETSEQINFYDIYIHNLFTINDDKIKFKIFLNNKPKNINEDTNEILFLEDNKDIYKRLEIIKGQKVFFRDYAVKRKIKEKFSKKV